MATWPFQERNREEIRAARDFLFDRERPLWPFVALLPAIFLFLVLYRRIRRRWRARREVREWMEAVRAVSREDRLTPEEEAALIRALSALDLSDPEATVESEEYFDTFVGPLLAADLGRAPALRVRAKIFGSPPQAQAD